jgi:predicted AlkP superfamily pyrophosphatase or phosphodiesterase
MLIKRFGIVLAFLIFNLSVYAQSVSEKKPYLIVVSLDGFRWDYPEIYHLTHFDSIAKAGVKAHSIQPSFPTVTFPNHYSLATGLYPEHHGIVQNKFYDADLKLTYSINDRKMVGDGRFYQGEPIWVTAEKQGVETASFYWVGSEAAIENIRPTYWKEYENKIPFHQRIDTLMNWLQLPETIRPHLIMFYLPEPDWTSHDFGPISMQNKETLLKLDSLMWVLVTKIKTLPQAKEINIIITSDHGMSAVSNDRKVIIDEYLKPQWIKQMYGHNPVFNIYATENCIDSIYNALNTINHIKVWKTKNIPVRLHYNDNKRIGDLVVLADSSWSISRVKDKPIAGGTHGYDNINMDMHGIFYACGPAFKQNYKRKTFPNTDLYNIMTKVLHLKAAANDGKFHDIKDIFR